MEFRVAAVFLAFGAASMALPGRAAEAVAPVWFVEAGAWDISDDGLPYRIGALLPSRHDPLSRWTGAREPRWVLALGYARVPDIYDDGTGRLSGAGGDGLLLGAAREWAWALPGIARDLSVAIDLGLSYATKSLPANGTNWNFIVSPGFTWERAARDGRAVWHVGLRWFHLSNADLFGRNAGYDGLSVRVGRSW